MIEFHRDKNTDSTAGQNFPIKVLGIGGAGSNILDRIASEGVENERLVILNTDVRALNGSKAGAKIQLGKNLTHGLGCGGDPDMGRDAALEAEAEIRAAVKGTRMIFLCAGLGGGTGSGATPVIARIAKEEGAFVVASVTIPFHFEGRRRLQQAQAALEELKTYTGALLTFENDRMGDLIVPTDGVDKAFSASDKTICQSIRAITSLVEKPGIIRVGMADVLAVLNGRDARVLFGFGRAEGSDRANAALQEALANPLLERGELLANASSVLVQISGGESVTLSEVETVMKQINEQLDDQTKLLFGVSTSQDLGNDLCVSIISSVEREDKSASTEEALATANQNAPVVSPQIRPLDPPSRLLTQPDTAAVQAPLQPKIEPAPAPQIQKPAAQIQPIPAPKVGLQSAPPQVAPRKVPKFTKVHPISPKVQTQPTLPVQTPAEAKTGSIVEKAPVPPAPAPPAEPARQLINPAYLQDDADSIPAIQRQGGEFAPAAIPPKAPAAINPPAAAPAGKKTPSIFKIAENQGIESAIPQQAAKPKVRIDFNEGDPEVGDGRSAAATPTITLEQPAPSIAGRSSSETAPAAARNPQTPVNLDPRVRGRFVKAQPTIVNGQDLDIPTFLRKRA